MRTVPHLRIVAIDPGPKESAYVVLSSGVTLPTIEEHGIAPNAHILQAIGNWYHDAYGGCDRLAIEMIACYGMAVGAETFDTCVWIGRFIQVFEFGNPSDKPIHSLLFRATIKTNLCGTPRAKDQNVRQALIDRWGGTAAIRAGDKETKKRPATPAGALYGIASHEWSALAVGVTYLDRWRVGLA